MEGTTQRKLEELRPGDRMPLYHSEHGTCTATLKRVESGHRATWGWRTLILDIEGTERRVRSHTSWTEPVILQGATNPQPERDTMDSRPARSTSSAPDAQPTG